MTVAASGQALAQQARPPGGRSYLQEIIEAQERGPVPFTKDDFVRLVGSAPRTRIYLGEPFVANFRLINHSQFTITVVTRFHPRSSMKVFIRPERQRERQNYGPFDSGQYPPLEFNLHPFEERPMNVVIWGDRQTDSGLALEKPGVYQIRFELEVAVKNTAAKATIFPVDANLRSRPPFMVQVLPPPKSYADLVQTLIEAKAFPDLHVSRVPSALAGRMADLIDQYPATPITPYLSYALGIYSWNRAGRFLENQEMFDLASKHLQLASLATSAYKMEANRALIQLMDKKGLAAQARTACEWLLAEAPPETAPAYAALSFVKKYMINTDALDPIEYWDLLE